MNLLLGFEMNGFRTIFVKFWANSFSGLSSIPWAHRLFDVSDVLVGGRPESGPNSLFLRNRCFLLIAKWTFEMKWHAERASKVRKDLTTRHAHPYKAHIQKLQEGKLIDCRLICGLFIQAPFFILC